ncbi:nucleotidyltransferase family protein [Pelagibacteraceae bacterium]|nr:nucleotidyltransferase family protein [Pelagibacteraceae bacterium]
MKAILLSAGFGKRLMPYTSEMPKCLLPVKGKPLLEIWMDKLDNLGVQSFLINTHYMHSKVEDFVMQSKFKKKITLVYENQLLGTGGTLCKNLKFYDNQDGFLIHTDNYCEDSLIDFKHCHINRSINCDISMLLFRTDKPKQSGIAEINSNKILINFEEKPSEPKSNLANGAVFILSDIFIKQYKRNFEKSYDFSAEVIPKYLGRVMTYETKEKYLDIGTPDKYLSVR